MVDLLDHLDPMGSAHQDAWGFVEQVYNQEWAKNI